MYPSFPACQAAAGQRGGEQVSLIPWGSVVTVWCPAPPPKAETRRLSIASLDAHNSWLSSPDQYLPSSLLGLCYMETVEGCCYLQEAA